MRWAKTLNIPNNLDIENRVLKILVYLNSLNNITEATVSGFDATGLLGNKLTLENNRDLEKRVSLAELIDIFKEEGQVFDMELDLILNKEQYKILIIRGDTVDVLGDGDLPDHILGDYKYEDIDLVR
jgi:hypothetical protein